MTDNNLVRLNKFLAFELGVSRREADDLIAKNQIKINGEIARLGARVSNSDKVSVNNKLLSKTSKNKCIALNKPRGYVCSRRKQGDNPTIYELIPNNLHNLKPIGRLDKDSSGLILLSNDGDFAYRMTHPSFCKTKIYKVLLDKDLEPLHQQIISDFGINLEDGVSKFQLERADDSDRRSWIVTMHEGRNRQIRRTFRALGYEITKLHRTNFGNYSIGDLKRGEYITVSIL